MKEFDIIIKDKDGKEMNTNIKTLDIDSNEIKIISFVCDDYETGYTLADILKVKFEEMGLKNFLIMPIHDKDHEISIKTIRIDD